jgi:putative transposase
LDSQKELLEKHFGCNRFIYNTFLKKKQEEYLSSGKGLTYSKCCKILKELKDNEFEWLSEVNSQTLQQSIQNLETAYGNFFRKKSKFPSFKKKSNNQSFRVPQHISLKDNKIQIPKFKEGINIVLHRKLEGEIKSVTISKTPTDKYFASILMEVPKKSTPKTGRSVGIDLGITDFIVTSDGEKVKNPNFNRSLKQKLSKAQKHLSRKTKGSNRYKRQRKKVARIHEKITNSRRDFQHKVSTRLINEYDMISLESLAVKNMVKNRCLSYSISDSSWSSFVSMLEYKAQWYGKEIRKIDRWYPSSKTCSSCDFIIDKLSLSVRKWKCPKCSCEHDRDVNAAKNIHRQGLTITDVEMEALDSARNSAVESTVCEASKKRSYVLRLKPLGLAQR